MTFDRRRVVWDDANRRHVLHDHPERELTEAEINEALTDSEAIEEWDAAHSATLTIGRTQAGRALVVAWTPRDGGCYPVHARQAGRAAKEKFNERET